MDAASRTPDFRLLFDAAPTPSLVLAPGLTIVAVNEAYLRATSTVREHLLGSYLFDALPAELKGLGVHNLRASLQRVLADRRPDTLLMHITRRAGAEGGGLEERQWSLLNTPVLDENGAVSAIIQQIEDVTERRRLEEELQRSQRDFEDFFENSVAAMHWVAADGTILRANQAELDLLGYTREEYVGRQIGEFHADGATINDILARLSGGEAIDKYPARLRAKDGSIRHVIISSSVQFRDEQFANTRCVTLDMTVEREAEARLRENFERQVEARTAELQRQSARLQCQASRLQRLAGELTSAEQRERKRLAAILHDGLQQLLVAAQLRLSQARHQARDAGVLSAIEGAAELLGQAVESSRTLTYQLRPPALYEAGLVSALRWLASELARLYALRVAIDAEEAEPALSDELKALLFESVRELLFNVVKHAGVNEAAVRVRCERERLRIAVEDEGGGFEVGAVDPSARGLGLFSIRERLAALGGAMAIESVPGGGASIRLEAPLTRSEREKGTAQTVPLSPALSDAASALAADRPTRVLVADDHAIVREGITSVLRDDKRLVVVGEAADGVEVLEAVARHHPDVVLMDVNMPHMNGVAAAREIRRRWPDVRIVALSVQDDATTAEAMLRAGAAAFVSKSDDPDHLIQVVLTAHHNS